MGREPIERPRAAFSVFARFGGASYYRGVAAAHHAGDGRPGLAVWGTDLLSALFVMTVLGRTVAARVRVQR